MPLAEEIFCYGVARAIPDHRVHAATRAEGRPLRLGLAGIGPAAPKIDMPFAVSDNTNSSGASS